MSNYTISICRQVFLNLPTEATKQVYVTSVVESELAELDETDTNLQYISDDVFDIVSGIEKLVAEYGIDGWRKGRYAASKEVQLHRHTCGPLSVGIFDLSIEDDGIGYFWFSVYRCM